MTGTRARRDERPSGPSPLDDLTDALGGYLSALGSSLVVRAGERVGDLTDRLADVADGGRSGGPGAQRKPRGVKDAVLGRVRSLARGRGRARGRGSRGGAAGGSVKATHILEAVDVGVPLRTAYDHWTQFEDFSRFTKGVRSVSRSDDVSSDWNVKVGPSSRSWKASVREQVPDDRIVWTSEGAKGTTRGAVTFHELAPSLTRIVVVVEYYPAGFVEKTGNLWRAQGRRLRLDLKHFVRHVTLHGDEELEGWRGEIRDGEVVRSHEEAWEDEEGEYEEEGAYGEEDEEVDEDAEEEEEDAEEEEEDEYAEDEPADEYDDDAHRDRVPRRR
ncbi:SRPBCC family protein [Streptomyces sp. NPDC096152]|uniref:SRPBCC family protein n=1 Tax=Streptomyces sp. NPDC096152 TaxID=3366078 RepID=UPI0037FA063B